MNLQEYLLTCLSEEAVELATELLRQHSIDKDWHFTEGLKPDDVITVKAEFNDIQACINLLATHNVFGSGILNRAEISREALVFAFHKEQKSLLDIVFILHDIQKAVSKMLRFGIEHVHPVKNIPGKTVLIERLNSLYAAMSVLEATLISSERFRDSDAIIKKQVRVMRYATIHLENIEKEET